MLTLPMNFEEQDIRLWHHVNIAYHVASDSNVVTLSKQNVFFTNYKPKFTRLFIFGVCLHGHHYGTSSPLFVFAECKTGFRKNNIQCVYVVFFAAINIRDCLFILYFRI